MLATRLAQTYGRDARDMRAQADARTLEGARAALESFYFGFNTRSLEVLDAIWAPDADVTLANPLGGILAGDEDIRALYQRIVEGRARVWVEYYDIHEYADATIALYAGRERGEFTIDDETIPLAIRTTRCLRYLEPLGWRQVHHHGSIDDPDLLGRYQAAVRDAR